MASNNSKSKSILKSSSAESKSSRRGVSFATNVNTQSISNTNTAARSKPRTNAGDETANMKSTSTGKSRMMNDVEEDAFDPCCSLQDTDMSILDIDNTDTSSLSLKQIRDLKSKRAMQRVAAGAVDVFDGEEEEEEGDECYSLLQQDDEEGQKQGQGQGQDKGKEGLDLNGNQSTSKNNNNSNSNSEKQKQEACPIEPFNMTSEREDGSGYFDGDTYVFRRGNPEEEEDAWLDQLDSKDSSSNINAKNKNNTNTQSSIATTTASNINANINANAARDAHTRAMNEMTKEQIYDELVPLLATDSESILQALGRYGSIIKRETKQLKLLRKKQAKDPKQTQETQESRLQSQSQNANIKKETSASTKALNRLTELSNVCMMKYDDTAIYDRDRAYFTNILGKSDANEAMKRKRSYFTGADADVDVDAGMNGIDHGVAAKRSRGEADAGADVDANADTRKDNDAATNTNASKDGIIHVQVNTQWEYRGNEDNAIHGPYKTQEMMEWIKAGYFVGPMAVDVRMISRDAANTNGHKDEPESKSKEEVVDDLLGDLEDSDDENENEGEAEAKGRETGIDSAIASEWQRSDEIDFSKYQ